MTRYFNSEMLFLSHYFQAEGGLQTKHIPLGTTIHLRLSIEVRSVACHYMIRLP